MIQDVYMKVNDNSNIDEVKNKILDSLNTYKRSRFIFDATEGSVSLASMKKLKVVFDENKELVEKKLEETCIVLSSGITKKIVSFFIGSVKTIRPVRIL